jgi:pimeloyl-ACP methyl ester carboxylesterase
VELHDEPVPSHGPVFPLDHWRHRTGVQMEEFAFTSNGRRVVYSVSSNVSRPASAPEVWAINLHGYLAGGEMYARESAALAQRLGWHVVNPSFAGFGGSDPLPWAELSIGVLAEQVEQLRAHLGLGPVVLLGHSMGAAVAVEYAARYADRTVAIIYRDGIATPSWQDREGLMPRLLGKVAPDLAPVADMAVAVVADLPDLLVGRLVATLRSVMPDVRRNLKTLAHAVPLGSMLMEVDQRTHVAALRDAGIPLLAEWGCFDHLTDAHVAAEFAELAGVEVQWVPGGHSWMLARPGGQADLLEHTDAGRTFTAALAARAAALTQRPTCEVAS